MFRVVASGATTDRAQLRRALAQLATGDVLMVTRLDRLAPKPRITPQLPQPVTRAHNQPSRDRLYSELTSG